MMKTGEKNRGNMESSLTMTMITCNISKKLLELLNLFRQASKAKKAGL